MQITLSMSERSNMLEVESQCGDGKRKKKSVMKTRSRIFRWLYFWEKIIGINPLYLTENNDLRFSYGCLFYGCFLITISCYILYCVSMDRVKLVLPEETPIALIVDFMGIGWEFLEATSTLLVFAIYQNRIKCIIESFVTAEKICRKLGIQDDYERQFKTFACHVTINNILNLATIVLSESMWSYIHTFEMLVWWIFNAFTVVSFNMGILFVWSLILVNEKFRRLNEKVRFLMENKYSEGNKAVVKSSGCCDYLSDKINLISELHCVLRNIICRIAEHFALPVIFAVCKNSTYLTFHSYMVYRYAKAHKPLGKNDIVFYAAASHWVINAFIGLIVVSNVCGSTLYEANNTGNILHVMLNNNAKFGDTQEAAKLNLLSLDLLKNRVRISVLGLFDLDNFLIYGTIATTITHLMIMVQLYE